jgi:hypothetical protein
MASADFTNVTLRNIAPSNADGSFINTDYVFTVGSNAKQLWTNNLKLNSVTVSTILIKSSMSFVDDISFGVLGVSTGNVSTINGNNLMILSTSILSSINSQNITYSTLAGIIDTTVLLTASTANTTNLGFSTGRGLLLTTNSHINNSSIITSTLNGINLTYSTLQGSTLGTSSLFFSTGSGSTLTTNVSHITTLNLNNGFYSTLTGSSIVTSTLSVSTVYYSTIIGSTIVTSTITGSTVNYSTATGSTLTTCLLNVRSTHIGSTINVINATYSTLLGSTMTFNTGFYNSTLIGSTTNVINATYSTLLGSTMTFNTGFSNSTLIGSTINMINMTYSTLLGSTMTFNTGFYNSTMIGSTVNVINATYSTLSGSTLVYNTGFSNSTLIGSTINVINATYSTLLGSTMTFNTGFFTSTLTGSTLTATSVNYSTLQGSTITASTMALATRMTISSGNLGVGLTNPTYNLQTAPQNSVNLSGSYLATWTTVSTDITGFTSTYNGTLSGNSSQMTFTLTSPSLPTGNMVFNGTVIPGTAYRLTFTVRLSGTTPSFYLFNRMANDAIIPGTSSVSITNNFATYIVQFTAPSGVFGITFSSQAQAVAVWNAMTLEGFFNQSPGGVGIGTTNPQYSLHVANGSVQAYNYQQFEWNNTQTSNTIGFNNINTSGLFKVATMNPVSNASSYGMINIRGHLGGWLASNSMYIDITINTRQTFKVYGTVCGAQPTAAPLCDIVYSINGNNQYDIYIHLNKNVSGGTYLCYDLVVSGNSGNSTLYDPAAAVVTLPGTVTPVSVTASANLYANNLGYVGIGTATPAYALHVIGTIYATGDIGALSDRRHKNDITPLHGCLDMLDHMSGYSYTRTDYKPGERQIGLIAQEVKEVLPEAVNYDSVNDTYSVNYGCLIAPLMEAVKELRDKVNRQETIIQKLLDRLDSK